MESVWGSVLLPEGKSLSPYRFEISGVPDRFPAVEAADDWDDRELDSADQ